MARSATSNLAEITSERNEQTIGGVLEVDIGIAKRAASHLIAADTHRRYGANGVKHIEERGLVDLREEVPDVEGAGGNRASGLGRKDALVGSGVILVLGSNFIDESVDLIVIIILLFLPCLLGLVVRLLIAFSYNCSHRKEDS
jgi:hypothetical protein